MGTGSTEYDDKTIHAITSDCEKLLRDLSDPSIEQLTVEKEFHAVCIAKYGTAGAALPFMLLKLLEVKQTIVFNTAGDILMPNAKKAGRDTVDASMNAGRDIISSAGRVKNKATIRDNNTKTENIDQSHSVNPKLVKALESGRKAIDKLKMTEAMKELLKKEYEELAAEVSKPKPEKSAVKKLWESVSHFAGKAAPLIGLGKLIAGMFGLKLAGVETTPEA